MFEPTHRMVSEMSYISLSPRKLSLPRYALPRDEAAAASRFRQLCLMNGFDRAKCRRAESGVGWYSGTPKKFGSIGAKCATTVMRLQLTLLMASRRDQNATTILRLRSGSER